jgi:hypothetical protein
MNAVSRLQFTSSRQTAEAPNPCEVQTEHAKLVGSPNRYWHRSSGIANKDFIDVEGSSCVERTDYSTGRRDTANDRHCHFRNTMRRIFDKSVLSRASHADVAVVKLNAAAAAVNDSRIL